ncbi:hypothetical protein [Ruegeria arenilitoris]|nr:hypothetical protein [Ruegeria arenilitoris]
MVAIGPLRTQLGTTRYTAPYVELEQGSDQNDIKLRWPESLSGEVSITIRADT